MMMASTFPSRRRSPLLDRDLVLRAFEAELDYVDMDKENVGPEERAALRGRRRSLSSILQS